MREIKFFDANLFIGAPPDKALKSPPDAGALIKIMEEKGIEKALVWHIGQYHWAPSEGNELLSRKIRGRKELFGVWTILPPQTGEIPTESFFARMSKERVFALRVFPDFHKFLLNGTVFGDLMREIVKRKIPLIFSLMREPSWEVIYSFMKEFPQCTCIVSDTGIWGTDRYFRPLLENYPNLHVETSLLSLTAGCLENAVKDYGPERFVFGTGFPERYIESSVLDLLRADIPCSAKKAIASENMERIISLEELPAGSS